MWLCLPWINGQAFSIRDTQFCCGDVYECSSIGGPCSLVDKWVGVWGLIRMVLALCGGGERGGSQSHEYF